MTTELAFTVFRLGFLVLLWLMVWSGFCAETSMEPW